MFWLSYECFSILCNAFLLKSAISSHNSCGKAPDSFAWAKSNVSFTVSSYAILVVWNDFPEAPSNIMKEKVQVIQAMSSEQHLVTLFAYVYIKSFTSKKHKVILSLLWKSAETKA